MTHNLNDIITNLPFFLFERVFKNLGNAKWGFLFIALFYRI